MATVSQQPTVGTLLRAWRERRRLSQLELALDCGVSTRHLSFVETGKSRPGRETLLRILEHLDVPFREQNRLLLAAGHAPAFPERTLDDPDLAPVRAALDVILARHEPYPAMAVDRLWNIVATNAPVQAIAELIDIDPVLLRPPVNAVRVGLHPRGMAPLIVDYAHWRSYFLERLDRQLSVTGAPELAALIDEVSGYAAPEEEPGAAAGSGEERGLLGPLRVRAPDGTTLSFFGMFATFDTPFEVTTSELALELLFPADETTAEAFRSRGGLS